MKFATGPAPHTVNAPSVRQIMMTVLLALVPVVIAHVVCFGYGILIQIALASIAVEISECVALKLRGKPVFKFATDGSALITAVLLALAMPPLAPWWLGVSGAVFAISVAKHLYGGLGHNLFNPAMVGYAALLVSFPVHMTHWPLPNAIASVDLSFAQSLKTILVGDLPSSLSWDAISGATPLASVRAGLTLRATMEEIHAQPSFGTIAGVGWEWISLAAVAGGVLLLVTRTIRWHIPLTMLTAIFVCSSLMHMFDPGSYDGPFFHLFSGATMLGAFFIATDPVSAASSYRGRLIYGAGIGVLTYAIRAWGGYPDGVAFAVLVMNAAVPLIDRYTVPRIYGHAK
jgi:electron transport complex protein RnfD